METFLTCVVEMFLTVVWGDVSAVVNVILHLVCEDVFHLVCGNVSRRGVWRCFSIVCGDVHTLVTFFSWCVKILFFTWLSEDGF